MISRAALWRKEWFLLSSPWAMALWAMAWLAFALVMLAAFQEYQALAPKLAGLDLPRGASDMLLGSVSRVLFWLQALWGVLLASRLLADEYQQGTIHLYRRYKGVLIAMKALAVFFSTMGLGVAFWLSVVWLSQGTRFDPGVLFGIACAQGLVCLYATGLGLAIASIFRHALASALFSALLLVLLWLLPGLISSPAVLVEMSQWFSPFAHANLLVAGQFVGQTLVFALLHGVYFFSLIVCFYLKDDE